MISDDFGTLHLPTVPPQEGAALLWSDYTVNTIAVLVSVALLLINLRSYLRLLPVLTACLFRVNPNISLEHNFHTAADRNNAAWTMLIPFAILMDRFSLYRPSFLEGIPPEWSLASTLIPLAAFILARYIFFPLRPVQLNGDNSRAAHLHLFSNFSVLVPTLLLSLGIMMVLQAQEPAIKTVLLAETGLFYFFSILMTGRILARQCSALPTFLYLCALEIIPAALIVVPGLIF